MTRRLHDSAFTISLPRQRSDVVAPRTITRTVIFVGSPSMHVRLGHPIGVRHRILIDHVEGRGWRQVSIAASHTPCGESIIGRYYAQLDESYEYEVAGQQIEMCTNGCFTQRELDAAAKWKQREIERLRVESAAHDAERAEHSRQLEADRAKRVADYHRRFDTGPIDKPDPDDAT